MSRFLVPDAIDRSELRVRELHLRRAAERARTDRSAAARRPPRSSRSRRLGPQGHDGAVERVLEEGRRHLSLTRVRRTHLLQERRLADRPAEHRQERLGLGVRVRTGLEAGPHPLRPRPARAGSRGCPRWSTGARRACRSAGPGRSGCRACASRGSAAGARGGGRAPPWSSAPRAGARGGAASAGAAGRTRARGGGRRRGRRRGAGRCVGSEELEVAMVLEVGPHLRGLRGRRAGSRRRAPRGTGRSPDRR